jgi:DnaK suppressor protein
VLEGVVRELGASTRRRDSIWIEKTADEHETMLGAIERELAVRNLETESAKLRDTQAALLRIDQGTFGTCLECDEAISSKRLAALPAAALCIRCQQALDCDCAASSVRPNFALAA